MTPVGIVAAVIGVAVVAGLIFWLTRPSQDDVQQATPPAPTTASAPVTTTTTATSSESDERLVRQLPKGYPSGACETLPAPEGVLAQVNCARNVDPDGPESAIFSLVADRASLENAFNDAIAATVRVDCPGKIQSPGPWRRNATPDRVSGQLYCGFSNGQPTVVWTDEEKMTVSAVRAGPTGPTFPQLYAWWSSHS
nr:serine/threonine-protein kinase [Mycolicibacterium komanii]